MTISREFGAGTAIFKTDNPQCPTAPRYAAAQHAVSGEWIRVYV